MWRITKVESLNQRFTEYFTGSESDVGVQLE